MDDNVPNRTPQLWKWFFVLPVLIQGDLFPTAYELDLDCASRPYNLTIGIGKAVSVAVTEVRLLSDSNKTDYVLHGEGATLTCHYVLGAEEKVKAVRWDKDGTEVYLWMPDQLPIAMDVLEGYVDIDNMSPSTIVIVQAHKDMHGTYTCRVETRTRAAQNEIYLMVIVDACKEKDWQTHTDMIECTETLNMHCIGMFPRPSPSCGIYSVLTGKYLTSSPFDSVVQLKNQTYDVSFNRVYNVRDWLNHTDIVFLCNIRVEGTTWRTTIQHRLFGDPGCSLQPPELKNGYYNVSGEKTCWGTPRDGSRVTYHCDGGFAIQGPQVLVCRNTTWTTVSIRSRGKLPVCSGCDINSYSVLVVFLILGISISSLSS